jgi:hypothetical protein
MNVLVTGSGRSGSWIIRGEQLGRAMGATVLANAIDIGPFDVAVVVKRPPVDLVRRIHTAAVPLVWDIVDRGQAPVADDLHHRIRVSVGRLHPEIEVEKGLA